MKTTKLIKYGAGLFVGALLVMAGCSNGLSTQDAYAACNALGEASPTSTSFAECVACFENCDDCSPSGKTPETYSCPGDPVDTSSGSSSSSASTGTGM